MSRIPRTALDKTPEPPASSERTPLIVDHVFKELGDQRYSLELAPAGIVFSVDRLRRHSHELIGELKVTVNGKFPHAKTVDDVLTMGDFNFSAIQTRTTRAKLLAERSGNDSLDWYGFLEEFCVKTIECDRSGRPAVILANETAPDESQESWDISGWPVLQNLPMVLYGDSSSGKSYYAMWIAGQLAKQGIPVLYADWEFAVGEHRKRFERLFQPMPAQLLYVRCERSIREEIDRLVRLIHQHQVRYVICDSIGFAVDGPAESQEAAGSYFRYVRQLGVGTLNIAHIPKQYDDGREAQIYGSVFFKNGARSVWFIERAEENPLGELRFGLYHKKNNIGEKLPATGYKLLFRHERTLVERFDLQTVEELTTGLPLVDRIKIELKPGAMTRKALAQALNAKEGSIRVTVSRHKSQFVTVGSKIGLAAMTSGDNLDF